MTQATSDGPTKEANLMLEVCRIFFVWWRSSIWVG